MNKSVSNLLAKKMLTHLGSKGLDTDRICKACNILPTDITNPGGRIIAAKHYKLLTETIPYLDFNERVFSQNLSSLYDDYPELIGYCLNSRNPFDAIHAYSKYRTIIGNCDSFIITETDDKMSIEYINEGSKILGSSQAIFNFASIFKIMKKYEENHSIKLSLTNDIGKNSPLEDFFGTRCQWNEKKNILEINKIKTEKTYEKYNSTLADFQKEKLDKKISELSENIGFASIVSRIVLNTLHNKESSDDENILDSICYKLNMSRWTLNRHLHLEGVNFQSILKEIRMKEACRLLKESHLTLQEISEIIGFSSQSTFTRFFKGQFDVNPSNFRKNN